MNGSNRENLKVNIAILNYNGRGLLKECLPSIIRSVKQSKFCAEVTVLDNCSTDNSIEFLKDYFKDVNIRIATTNRFLCSFNEYASESDADILIFLNNDIKVSKHFIDPLISVFKKYPDAFMSSPKCFGFDKSTHEGADTRIGMRFGFFQAFSRYPGYEKNIDIPGYTASAGSILAFRRDRFIELGGYDDLYLPGRMEDVDLCYRGWKRGYKAYYVPESIAYHKGMVSFKKHFGYQKSLVLSYRNTFLFMWKNITSPFLLIAHLVFLVPWLILSLLKLKPAFVIGFMQAIPKMPEAVKRRFHEQPLFKKHDIDILRMLGWKRFLL
jgi:N-acetylglucosaminyl-diphospho-decaprenol L-rhamnosyltransferase